MTKRRGFTLIELLVVIAIIALLLSILMPALRKVKEQASMVKCLANLKQWNLVFSMYLQENDGKFFSGFGNDAWWWTSQLDDKVESYKQNKTWFCPKSTAPLQTETGAATQRFTIYSAWGIYNQANGAPSHVNPDGVSGSYGLNGWLLDTPAKPGTALAENRNSSDFWRTPQVSDAAHIPVFIEALRFDLWPQPTNPAAANELAAWTADNHMARCCINRHIGTENVSFADWSARKVGLKELWTLKWHKNFVTRGPWTQAGGVRVEDWPDWIRPFKDY